MHCIQGILKAVYSFVGAYAPVGRRIYRQPSGYLSAMSLDSTVGLARPETKSLRATIPEGIVAYLGIQAGDKLDWTMENDKNGERIVVVRKSKTPTLPEKLAKKRK